MKMLVLVVLCVAALVHAETSPDPDAQAKAVERYPQLATAGSPFNARFVEKVREAREKNVAVLNDARWPLLLAEKVGKELGVKPVTQALANDGSLNAPSGGRLQRIVKMTVAEVAASPFSLEGALVELTGIDRIAPQEVEKGVYEVTIWGPSGSNLRGTLPAQAAHAAEHSSKLFVSVSEPKKRGTKINIHGNAASYQGLSTVPTVGWSAR